MNKIEELQELAKPIFDYLLKNYNPHTTIILNQYGAKIVEDLVFVPNKED